MEDDIQFLLRLIDNIRGIIDSYSINLFGTNRAIKTVGSTSRIVTLTDSGFLSVIYQKIYGHPIPMINGEIDYTNTRVQSLQQAIDIWKNS
jgi:hypothetical protein